MSEFDFEKAFDNCNIDEQQQCDTPAEDEEAQTFANLIKTKLLNPNFSGVNFSRWDVKRIAYEFGEKIPTDERKKMIAQLLKYVDSEETLNKLFNIIKKFIDERVGIYNELSQTFPASKPIFDGYIVKTNDAKKLLDDIAKGNY